MKHYVGQSIPKVDSHAIIFGKALYTDDIALKYKDVLEVKLLRSPHAHAKIKDIDISKALKTPGVVAIYTHHDVPNIRYTGAGQTYPEPSPYDKLILEDTVRYVGDEVAIIAAETTRSAERAMKKIKVKYEVLDAVLDLKTAIDHPVKVHAYDPHFNIPASVGGMDVSRNIVGEIHTKFGRNMDEVVAEADIILNESYDTQAQAQSMMETFGSYTYMDEQNRIVIISSTQVPFHIKRQVSRALGIPYHRVRVIKPRVGGGFGAKQTIVTDFFAAFVTMKTGRACKLILDRSETGAATNSRHAMHLDVQLAATKDGIIQGLALKSISDQGAYGTHAWTTLGLVGEKSLPLYNRLQAASFDAQVVYTNKMAGGAFRGYGATQGSFAIESTVNTLAKRLGMDPIELRLKNIVHEGEKTLAYNKNILSCSLDRCIERGKKLIKWDEYYPYKQIDEKTVLSVGMSVSMQGSGIANLDTSTVEVKLSEDGDYIMYMSPTDVGTGADTILQQMAAEVLRTSLSNITAVIADTDLTPYDPGSYASSGTYVTGGAVVRACEDLICQIIEVAALEMEEAKEHLYVEKDKVRCTMNNKTLSIKELAIKNTAGPGRRNLTGVGSFGSPTSPPPYMTGFALVKIDLETGKTNVEKYVAIVDCGTVINPNLAKVQVEGGIVQGIGLALYEDIKYSQKGAIATNNFMQYRLPVREDIGEIIVEFIESHEPSGPFGAKSIGEIVINTPTSAINAAIENVTGRAIHSLPMTAEKIYWALQGKEM